MVSMFLPSPPFKCDCDGAGDVHGDSGGFSGQSGLC